MIFLSGQAYAVEPEEVIQAQADALELDELTEAAGESAPGITWGESFDLNHSLNELLETGTREMGGIVKKALRSGVILLAIVFFSGLADSAANCAGGRMIQAVPLAASMGIAAVSVADANSLIGMGKEVIERMDGFSDVLLPTVAAATVASGMPGKAAASQLATMLFSNLLMSLINRLLLPLVFAYIAMCTAHAAMGNEGLKRISSTLKWLITLILTTVLLAFVGYLTVSGVIAGATDAVALKATKFTVSSMVPVVGSILSDAAGTVLAGAGILKNSIGVFGMLAILGMCLTPFLQLGVHYLMYKMTAALSAAVGNSRVSGLIDGISGAFGLVLGMTGACALLFLVSMVSAVSVTGA